MCDGDGQPHAPTKITSEVGLPPCAILVILLQVVLPRTDISKGLLVIALRSCHAVDGYVRVFVGNSLVLCYFLMRDVWYVPIVDDNYTLTIYCIINNSTYIQ